MKTMTELRLILATVMLSGAVTAACGSDAAPRSGATADHGGAAGAALPSTSGSGGQAGSGTGGANGAGLATGGSGSGLAGLAGLAGAASAAGADTSGGGGLAGAAGAGGVKSEQFPLLGVLPLFTAANVPARGPKEANDIPPKWTVPATVPALTGKGLAQHPMLYFGESYRRIQVVIDGKLAWHYDTEDTWEIDDIWMLSNGNVLHAHMSYVEELTPQKEVVWRYNVPGGHEVHTAQPIGLDKVLFVESQAPLAHVKLYNKTTQRFEIDQEINTGTKVHTQCRRFRMTANGTYVAAYLGAGRVVELDKDFKEIWSYEVGSPWSAVPLKNGNVLIQSEGAATAMEVSKKSEVVWQVAKADVTLPPGTQMGNTQTCERLFTGNTVMFGNGGMNPKNIQAFEVTPGKEVVWFLQDWQNLGDATSAQFLDEPGYPEIPGDTNH